MQTKDFQDRWLCEDLIEGLLVVATIATTSGGSIPTGCHGRAQVGGSAFAAFGVASHNHDNEDMLASTTGSTEANICTFRVPLYIHVGYDCNYFVDEVL